MHILIDDLIEGVLRALEYHGRKSSTLELYEKKFYRPLRLFFMEQNGGVFDEKICASYISKAKSRHRSKMIGDHHLRSISRTVEYLLEFHRTGTVLPDRRARRKEFVPSKNALSLIQKSLDSMGYKDGYRYKMHCVLRKFFCYIEARGIRVQDVGIDTIRDYLSEAKTSNPSSMGYIVGGLKILAKGGYLSIESSHFEYAQLSPKHPPKKVIEPFTETEVASILESFDTETPIGKRNKAIVLLAAATGLRGGDIVSMKFTSLDWPGEEMTILQGKTGKLLVMPIPDATLNALSDYILNGRPSTDCDVVFIRAKAPYMPLKGTAALDSIVETACRRAGVQKKPWRSFHSLRRSCATWMAQDSVPVTTISQLLGHASMDSSQIYLSFDDSQISTCALTFDGVPVVGGVYA